MKKINVTISAAAALMLSALYFFDGSGLFSALLPAVLVHELGHALALRTCGARIRRVSLSLAGLSMDYAGAMQPGQEAICALCGPLFGAAFALAAAIFGRRLGSDYLLCAAGLSAALTVFNLLPAPILDGGRALSLLLPARLSLILGIVTGSALCLGGLYSLYRGYGAALIPAGLWIILLSH